MNNSRLLFISVIFILSSCGYEELPMQNSAKMPAHASVPGEQRVYKKKEVEPYRYKGDKYKDPFVPLTGEGFSVSGVSEDVVVPNIGNLTLKGIFSEGSSKMALIYSGGVNYILKGSRLYDNRQRLVNGISGVIKTDSVLMIAPDKTTKEIRLRSK